MKKTLPKVSFVIPTYNAQRYLDLCLKAVFSLDYPKNKIEVIVADGGSRDRTLEILNSYRAYKNLIVLENRKKIAEDGKYLAYQKSSGEYIVLLDSDNIIASRYWLKRLIHPLHEDESILGAESDYLVGKDFTSINTYATLLVIADPVARMLASKPEKIKQRRNYAIKTYSINAAPVSGANGFIWRKSVIDQYIHGEQLNESNLLWEIAKKEKVRIANVPGIGIYHYYCDSVLDYVKKRQKIAMKFLDRQTKQNTWVNSRSSNSLLYLSAIYLASIVGPTAEAAINISRHGNNSWLWHPIVGLITICIYFCYFILNILTREMGG